ncbi:DUF917 family protein [Microbacterium lacticum]|uniref:S-methyl thiohydantoin desulfurase domain-containing protein n=1 Tax=Microbacterium lacticum TaxID=33885 RepID=UPI001F55AE2F|nr:DUF917 family protein [Microbacterium lacticum]
MRIIGATDVDALASGARPFASGVNSSAFNVLADWARAALHHRPVRLLAPSEAAADDTVVSVTIVGAPSALAENLPSGSEPARALAALTRHLGRPITGFVPLNTAGENAMLALACAASVGVDLVDADACGRVVPRVEHSLLTLAGVPAAPAAVVSPFGELSLIDASTPRLGALVPPLVSAAGGWSLFMGYPTAAETVDRFAAHGTITRYLDATDGDALAASPHQRLLRGTITAVEQLGARRLSVVLRETGGRQRLVRAEAAEEFFLVLADGARLAASPDGILLLSEDGDVVDADRCRIGMRVEVAVVPVPDVWHDERDRS